MEKLIKEERRLNEVNYAIRGGESKENSSCEAVVQGALQLL
jgi:hypothetical protein